MKPRFALLAAFLCFASIIATSTKADQLYNNLTPNSSIGLASQTDMSPGGEVEAADDFIFTTPTTINSASFTGLISAGTFGVPTIAGVTIEIYRVFPFDSDTNRTPNVVTRANSPSDVAFASRTSSSPGDLTFSTATQASSFTTLNSVQVGGINPKPNQTTGGNGPVTGQEVQFDVTFTKPFDLPADHYFLVAQVDLTNGGSFYWLSGSRPISGAGTTPFAPDLQAWIRDENLDPDWSRAGTDIVGGTTPPTFNLAFSLDGKADNVPEPASSALVLAGMAFVAVFRKRMTKA